MVPNTSATTDVTAPTFTDSSNALRTSASCQATLNQWVVQLVIGQPWIVEPLKAESAMITSGIQRKAITSTDQIASEVRVPRPVTGPRTLPAVGRSADRRP